MDDLIRRAEAIEAVKNTEPIVRSTERNWGKMIAEEHSRALVKELKALPSADAVQGEWIQYSGYQPKENQEVYVTVYFTEGDTGRAYGYIDVFGKWHLYSAVEGVLNSGYKVTAWMPLPKPYREDGEA